MRRAASSRIMNNTENQPRWLNRSKGTLSSGNQNGGRPISESAAQGCICRVKSARNIQLRYPTIDVPALTLSPTATLSAVSGGR